MSAKVHTYEEIAQHNSRSDLWIVIEGKVYDITKFLDEVNSNVYMSYIIQLNFSVIASWW